MLEFEEDVLATERTKGEGSEKDEVGGKRV